MKIITSKTILLDKPVALAIGTFDGMHLGHKFLLSRLMEISRQNRCCSMVYTFSKHPMFSLDPDNAPPLLMAIKQKMLEFKKIGLDYVFIQNFDIKFSEISSQDFISNILKNYDIRHIVVGHDFRFGHKGTGDISLLKQLSLIEDFEVTSIQPYKINGQIVSSSVIRNFIRQGKVKKAADFLGYPYSLCGQVITGFGRGTKIGFPTANLQFNKQMAVPGFGVYLTKAFIEEKEYWGATSIGNNPTFFQDGTHIETYFLDFEKNLYGKRLKLFFIEKLRDQIRFDTVEELVSQISKDVEQIKYMVCKNKKLC
jgi:riboflavin kinase/FMN adenylyltransferase